MSRERLDVVAVPAGHPYVEHLLPAGGGPAGFAFRPDPDPDDPSRPATGRWWPPVALGPAWLAAQDCDVLHVHFGFDATPADQLAELLDVAEDRGIGVVVTVHDLHSPHQEDPREHLAKLDVLVPHADAVLTLTAGAAARIAARWGRVAQVVAHPHLVDLDAMTRLRAARRERVPTTVGVEIKALRTNTDPDLLPRLETACGELGLGLRVGVHRELAQRSDERSRATTRWLVAATRRGVDVQWHDRFPDDELWRWLADLDVAVLPYRFGTHSGWLEACHDVGTPVVAPAVGCYGDQGAAALFALDDTGSLTDALRRAVGRAGPAGLAGLDAPARRRQRERLAAEHDRTYRTVAAAARAQAERRQRSA
ncbi:glycosyltransferase family 4 protein [Nocardioides anomalus]|uniref:Glycosyltransferase family 4 protein n=1 Tax=Nocardioides anomalus TaxID=2712223 RepID=A0A6G6WDY6_9ACTN|nr:glycosyltransferase [Nocardioides anomalus]QIG43315.1 glycosyltransferase family 4 protein [Nocardioides anomalus]